MYQDFLRIVLMVACTVSAGVFAADTMLTPPLVTARPLHFTMDADGNQYIVGNFSGTLDLNPGLGDVSRLSAGSNDVFVYRLNADGGFAWGHSFGGTSSDSATAVTLNGGFVYVTGTNGGNAGFDGATGTTASGVFVLAFDAGTGVAKGDFDGDGIATYTQIASAEYMASSGTNLYIAANSTVIAVNASTSALDLSFSTDGIQTFGSGTSSCTIQGIAADNSRVYFAGVFTGTDVDIGATGAGTVDSVGGQDGFIAVLDRSNGNADTTFSVDGLVTFGGTLNEEIQGISVTNGTVFVSGLINSTDAGFGVIGTIARAGASRDGFVIALDSAGAPLATFDTDGALLLSPPGDGNAGRVRVSAELTGTTPGIAVQNSFTDGNLRVVVTEFDATGAKRAAFGFNGEILFDGNSTDTGLHVVRVNGRTAFSAFCNASSDPFIRTPNLIPRGLGGDANVVAVFSSDTGSPLYPHFIDVFPRADDVAGGRTVTFKGMGFGSGTPSVKIGAADATAESTTNGTMFTAAVPPAPAGANDYPVAITLANGRVLTTPNAFSYGTKAQATGPVFRGPALGGTVDADGNTYLVGNFNGTRDFDPSAGSDMHRSGGSVVTGFVTRFNADGSYAWTTLFTGIGNTTLNGVAVKGNRVFAVGDFQFVNLFGEATSNVGINGLSGQLCQGLGDGAILVLDRATGAAVTSVSGDGIVTVGGSTDNVSFVNRDTLFSISASPTANTLAFAGRMVSTNVGFNGLGAINANDGVLFFNCDTDLNVTQTVVKDYPLTPRGSFAVTGKVAYSPDGSKITGGVISGNQVDIYRFNGNVGTPAASFGPAGDQFGTNGQISLMADSDITKLCIAESLNTIYAGYVEDEDAKLVSLDITGLTFANITFAPSPNASVDNFEIVTYGPNLDLAAGLTVSDTYNPFDENGFSKIEITGEDFYNEFSTPDNATSDGNVCILYGDPSDLSTFCSSFVVCDDTGGGSEDVSVILPNEDGFTVCGSSSFPSTQIELFDIAAIPGEFGAFRVNKVFGELPPTITSTTSVNVTLGDALTYTITAINFDTIGADVSGLPWLSYDGNATLTGTPPAVGTYTCTIRADTFGASDIRTLTINVGVKPTITSALTATAKTGQPFTYTGTLQGPGTVSINPGNGVGYTTTTTTPDKLLATFSTPGTYTFAVTATNQFGTTAGTLTVTVTPAGIPPTITSPLSIELMQGEEYVYEMTATGSPTIVFNSFDPVFEAFINDSNLKFQLDKLGPPITVTQVGNSLHILCNRPDLLFYLTISANNFVDNDQKTIVCKSKRNPKAPKISYQFQSFGEVPDSGILLPFTVTGDEPLKVETPGFFTINNDGGNYAIDTTGSSTIVFFSVIATNPFGVDFVETFYTVLPDSDGDKIVNFRDPDNDNDGFPDELELSLGTKPFDPNSPSGVKITTTGGTSKDKKTTVTINNSPKTPELDSIFDDIELFENPVISVSRAAPKPTPGVLIYDLGGVSRMFVIDEKGLAVSGSDKCSVKLKMSKGQLILNVKISIKNANVKAALADEGLTDRNAKQEAVSVNSFIAYNGMALNRTVALEYSAKQGKKGSAKLKK